MHPGGQAGTANVRYWWKADASGGRSGWQQKRLAERRAASLTPRISHFVSVRLRLSTRS